MLLKAKMLFHDVQIEYYQTACSLELILLYRIKQAIFIYVYKAKRGSKQSLGRFVVLKGGSHCHKLVINLY